MDSRDSLLQSIAVLEARLTKQRERIGALRAQNVDPAHAIAILDEMTRSFVRLVERLEPRPLRKLTFREAKSA